MKTQTRFLLLAELLSFFSECFAQITFEKTFGGLNEDRGFSVQQTTDGGYIIVGSTVTSGVHTVPYLIKTNNRGDTTWTKTIDGGGFSPSYTVRQTTDGGYVMVGPGVYLVKTDAAGDTLWRRVYGGSGYSNAFCVQQTTDSGYVIAGQTFSSMPGGDDVYLIKTDVNGDTMWSRTFGGSDNDRGFWVNQTNDGGYIISGETYSFGAGLSDVYLVKTDANGDSMWTRTIGGIDLDQGSSVQETNDGGFIVAGSTNSFGTSFGDNYLIKTDSSGDTLWTKTFGVGNYDRTVSVLQTNDSGYIIAGSTASYGAGEYDLYLIKTDGEGDTMWTRTFGGTGGDFGYSVWQTDDGGYAVVGETNSFGAGESDIYFVKTDANGLLSVHTETYTPRTVSLSQNYPNPFNPSTTIRYELPRESKVSLKFYNLLGQEVATLVNELKQPGRYQVQWNAQGLSSGVYFYRLQVGEYVETRKLMLLK